MKMKNCTLLGAIILIVTACGKDAKQYSYHYSENGCSTGTKTASSQDELCALLADDHQNLNEQGEVCAYSMRYNRLKAECPGYQIHNSADEQN